MKNVLQPLRCLPLEMSSEAAPQTAKRNLSVRRRLARGHLYYRPATRGLAVSLEELDLFGASFGNQDG
jgi:hypothetical protein